LRDLIAKGDEMNPRHKLGAPLLNSYELAGNKEMGHRAQRRATVHALEPGITGSGLRKGRKGRTR
jgi:hypothetical protein